MKKPKWPEEMEIYSNKNEHIALEYINGWNDCHGEFMKVINEQNKIKEINMEDKIIRRIEAYLSHKQRKHDFPGFDCNCCSVTFEELKEASNDSQWGK